MNKELENKISKIRSLTVTLTDLEKILEGDLVNDEIKTKIEQSCWETIKEISKTATK